MNAFEHFRDELSRTSVAFHPSELHGMLIGYLCAVKDKSGPAQRRSLFEAWLDGEVPISMADFLEETFKQNLDSLGEFSDFDFSLMIPDDEAAIAERAESVSLWCSGFLSGFGESGRQLDADDASDVKEALQDMGRIAAMSDEVPDGEENESDLNEIIEFVRISTLLIFAETASKGAH
ncbi:MAG: UPF0149 family protein [Candidatus Azotimanducaceae bacterium WSBS_2022_MAG_OTU7]